MNASVNSIETFRQDDLQEMLWNGAQVQVMAVRKMNTNTLIHIFNITATKMVHTRIKVRN
jgi:hypothetical protein